MGRDLPDDEDRDAVQRVVPADDRGSEDQTRAESLEAGPAGQETEQHGSDRPDAEEQKQRHARVMGELIKGERVAYDRSRQRDRGTREIEPSRRGDEDCERQHERDEGTERPTHGRASSRPRCMPRGRSSARWPRCVRRTP